MLFYFEFESRRHKADVALPKSNENIVVHLTEKEMADSFPHDLFFTVDNYGKVDFEVEDKDNERLLDLQNSLRRRLQEFVNK